MPGYETIRAADISIQAAYDLLTNLIVPRPIALVSSLSAVGVPNLAPFSFFMAGGAAPPSVAISINLGGGARKKDSLANIEATGEFVVNLVDRAMAEAMNLTSAALPSDSSEWDLSRLHPLASQVVAPNRVLESPVHVECKCYNIVPHGNESGSAVYVIGEVLMFHLREDARAGFNPISRLGGSEYLDLAALERFDMARPS